MELRQLTYFKAVADAGTFVRAAARLRVAQPALSRSIAKLESEVCALLFHRTSAGVQLTEAGLLLYEQADDLLMRMRRLREVMAREGGQPQGMFSIGMPSSLHAIDKGVSTASFLASYPRAAINLVEDLASGLRDGVASGRLDVAVISTVVPPRGLRYTPLVTQGVGLCLPPDAPEKKLSRMSIDRLAGKPLIVTSRANALRLVLEEATAGSDWEPHVRAEVVGVRSMLDLVAAGAGYGVCPMSVHGLAKEIGLAVKPIEGLHLTWAVATSRERTTSTGVLRFIDVLAARVQDLVARKAWPTAVFEMKDASALS